MRYFLIFSLILLISFCGYSQSTDSVLLVFKGIPYEVKFRGYYTLAELEEEDVKTTTYKMKIAKSKYDSIFDKGGLEEVINSSEFDVRAVVYFYFENEMEYLVISPGMMVMRDNIYFKPSLDLFKFLHSLPKPSLDKYEGK